MTDSETIEYLKRLLTQANRVIASVGHKHGCAFNACTCGEVEKLKREYAEYVRLIGPKGWGKL